MKITVCLCTYKRNSLKDTLYSISKQKLPHNVSVDVSIADNDEYGSGKKWVDLVQQETGLPISYCIEPVKNIAHARNASVRNSTGDWLAFIDDDEVAESNWLYELYTSAVRYEVNIVIGYVEPVYPENTPRWICKGNYFGRDLPRTGAFLKLGTTANALVKRSIIPDINNPFDERLGKTGGEDTDFFHRTQLAGEKIVACREAIVFETIEESRLNQMFILRKWMRIGETYSRILFSSRSFVAKSLYISRAALQMILAAIITLVLLPTGRAYYFRYAIKTMSNWGKVRYFLRYKPVELYK